MSRFVTRHKHWITAVFVLAFATAAFELVSFAITPVSVDEPISLSPPGIVEKTISAPLPEIYDVSLAFSFDSQSREKVRRLVGEWLSQDGRQLPSGVPVPIRWSVKDRQTGREVLSEEKVSIGSNAYSGTTYYRPVGNPRLDAGDYLFRAKIRSDVPEFADIPVRIVLGLRPKIVSHWLREWEFWGRPVIFYAVAPLTIVLALIVGALYLRDVRRARRDGRPG
jgi:hypothetical protein